MLEGVQLQQHGRGLHHDDVVPQSKRLFQHLADVVVQFRKLYVLLRQANVDGAPHFQIERQLSGVRQNEIHHLLFVVYQLCDFGVFFQQVKLVRIFDYVVHLSFKDVLQNCWHSLV